MAPAHLSAGGGMSRGVASLFKILPPTVAVACFPRQESSLLRVDVGHYQEREWSVRLTAATVPGEVPVSASAAASMASLCSLTLCLHGEKALRCIQISHSLREIESNECVPQIHENDLFHHSSNSRSSYRNFQSGLKPCFNVLQRSQLVIVFPR